MSDTATTNGPAAAVRAEGVWKVFNEGLPNEVTALQEVDLTVDALTSIIEPIMIVMLAIVVGVIVIAMFMPLVQLVTSMAK